MAKRTRRVFTPEYKAEAVRLAQAGNGNIAATARDVGIDITTLRDWLHRASTKEPDSSSFSPSEKQELLQLRRDVSVLRMECEILKNRPRGSAHLWKEKLLRAIPSSPRVADLAKARVFGAKRGVRDESGDVVWASTGLSGDGVRMGGQRES